MALEKGLILPMALKNTGERADTSRGSREKADTLYGIKQHWKKG